MAAPGPIKFSNFGYDAAAEKVRLAFVLGGIDFEDHRVSREEWLKMKPTTKYGQLPIMKVGNDEPSSQSSAMLRWAGHLGGLNPPEHVLKIEEAIGLAEDLQREVMPSFHIAMRPHILGYPEDMPEDERKAIQMKMREKLIAPDGGVLRFLGYLQGFLGDNQYMAGDKPTIADCQVIPMFLMLAKGNLDGFPANMMDGFPKLKEYFDRFLALERVKAYYEKLAAAAQ